MFILYIYLSYGFNRIPLLITIFYLIENPNFLIISYLLPFFQYTFFKNHNIFLRKDHCIKRKVCCITEKCGCITEKVYVSQ